MARKKIFFSTSHSYRCIICSIIWLAEWQHPQHCLGEQNWHCCLHLCTLHPMWLCTSTAKKLTAFLATSKFASFSLAGSQDGMAANMMTAPYNWLSWDAFIPLVSAFSPFPFSLLSLSGTPYSPQIPEGMQSLFLHQPQSELNKAYCKCQVRWVLFTDRLESSQLSSFKTVIFKFQCCDADIITSQQCPLSQNKTLVWFDKANTFSLYITPRLLKLWGFTFYFAV